MDDRDTLVRRKITEDILAVIHRLEERIEQHERNLLGNRIVLKGRVALGQLPTYVTDDDDTAFRVETERLITVSRAALDADTRTKDLWLAILTFLHAGKGEPD